MIFNLKPSGTWTLEILESKIQNFGNSKNMENP